MDNNVGIKQSPKSFLAHLLTHRVHFKLKKFKIYYACIVNIRNKIFTFVTALFEGENHR